MSRRPLLFFLLFLSFCTEIFSELKEPQVAAVTEGEPSWNVCKSVNVLTGDFFINEEDLIIEGVEPIRLSRTYISGNGKGENGGWHFIPHLYARVLNADCLCQNEIYLAEPSGTMLTYTSTEENIEVFLLDIDEYGDGITNCSQGEIGGRTNLKNNRIYYSKEMTFRMVSANGTERLYKREKHKGFKLYLDFYLQWEKLPNGNFVHYEYDDYKRISFIKTQNPSQTKTYAWARFHYEGKPKNTHNFDVETSDGRRLQYEFLKLEKHKEGYKFYLQKVSSPEHPEELFYYNPPHKEREAIINHRTYPVERFLHADYYKTGINEIGDSRIKVHSKEDPREDRVRMLSAPVGAGTDRVLTHRFFYDIQKVEDSRQRKKKGKYIYTGKTDVLDAHHNKTSYYFGHGTRPSKVERFRSIEYSELLYNKEEYAWINGSDLHYKKLSDAEDKGIQARVFSYDDRGNVLEEKLLGNLTGHNFAEINNPIKNFSAPAPALPAIIRHPLQLMVKLLRARQTPPPPPSPKIPPDVYSVHYSYTANNLIERQEEANGRVTRLSYLPGTDRPTSRLTCHGDRILLREFFEYDGDHILIKIIKDDGSSSDKNDLTNVSQRLIKAIFPRTEMPALGLPGIIEERYWDPKTSQEVLLKKIVFAYSKECRVVRQDIYDSANNFSYSLHTNYDEMGRPIEESNAIGQFTKRRFDILGNKVYEEDFSGKLRLHYLYDYSNRLIRLEEESFDGSRHITHHRYDYKYNKTATIDDFGHETRFQYDAFGHLTGAESPQALNENGVLTTYKASHSYDSMGHEIAKTDARGHTTKIVNTIRGKPSEVSHPDGTKEHFIYNLSGTLQSHTDQIDTTTSYSYDIFERPTLKKITSATGEILSQESFVYNAFHLLSKTDAMGVVTTYEYDAAGRKISEAISTENGLEKTTISYDSLGRLHSVQKEDLVSIKEYDLLDRVLEERDEDIFGNLLNRTKYTYDSMGNKAEITRLSNKKELTEATLFDTFKRPTKHVDMHGQITHIVYNDDFINPFGQRVLQKTTTDPKGVNTIETYDALGRIATLEIKNPFGDQISFDELYYDGSGNLTRQVCTIYSPDRSTRSVATKWEYDSQKRLLMLVEAQGSPQQKVTRYSYNAKGLLETITKSDGTVIEHGYDALGRLTEQRTSDGTCHYAFKYNLKHLPIDAEDVINQTTTKRSYDSQGRLLQEQLSTGHTLKNEYDLRGRRIKLYLPDQSAIKYSYDAAHLREIERFDASGYLLYAHRYTKYDLLGHLLEQELIGDLGKVEYFLDEQGRLSAFASEYGSQEIEEYDDNGNILRVRTDDETTQYSYDSLNQLISETGIQIHHYGYDSQRNRLRKDESVNLVDDLNRLITTSTASYTYDLAGNTQTCKEGEVLTRYTYDALDRLVSIEKPDLKSVYTYDAFHRRISKAVYSKIDGQWIQEQALHFIYDGQNEIGACEPSGKNIQLRVLGNSKGAEIGAAVAIEINEEVYAPLHDLFGNVAKLISIKSRQAVESYSYSAFGEEIIFDASKNPLSSSSIGNPWRYSSKRVDEESGLVFFGRRYYDPNIGRWLTPDPQGFIDGLNLYCFVLNDPLLKIDQYGLNSEPPQTLNAIQFPVSQVLSSIGTAISNFFHFLGGFITGIGRHFIPDLFGGAFIRAMGRMMKGDISPEVPIRSYIGKVGRGDLNPLISLTVGPGMLTYPGDNIENMWKISDVHGGQTVYFAYNSTHGFLRDLFDCIYGKCGFITRATKLQVLTWRWRISEMGGVNGGGIIIHYPHSEGGIITENALKMLTPQERMMIRVISFGSAALFSSAIAGEVTHFVSLRDGVPLTDTVRYVKALTSSNSNVQFIGSLKGLPLVDHGLRGETYWGKMVELGADFVNKHGTVK